VSIFLKLSKLAFGQLVSASCAALKFPLGDDAVNTITDYLKSHLVDESQQLTSTLQEANVRTWEVLEIALDDSRWTGSFLNSLTLPVVLKADERAFAEQIRGFLGNRTVFRKAALGELRKARADGVLNSGNLNPKDLASHAAPFARFADPVGLLAAQYQVMEDLGKELESSGYKQLGWLLRQPLHENTPLGVLAVRYFFRRAIEEDSRLFQGQAIEMLQALLGDIRAILTLLKRQSSLGGSPAHLAALGTPWDGITRVETIGEIAGEGAVKERIRLADAAKHGNWEQVFEILDLFPKFVNSCRPGGSSLYAPLHQAAFNAAPPNVVELLIDKGAWRTLRNATGKRPIDVAEKAGHTHLKSLLEPQSRRRVPTEVLRSIQSHFHALIRGWVSSFDDKLCRGRGSSLSVDTLRMPELEPLDELVTPWMWFWVPQIAGGFSYWLAGSEKQARLISICFSRGMGGIRQWEINSEGSKFLQGEPSKPSR
jgi:hypothetical protein